MNGQTAIRITARVTSRALEKLKVAADFASIAVIVVLIWWPAYASAGENDPPANAQDSSKERQAKIASIKTWYGKTGQAPDRAMAQSVDVLASMYAAQLGTGNPNWGPAHKGWQAVHDQILSDIKRDQEGLLKRSVTDAEERSISTIADALSTEDVNSITRFSTSEAGNRYWTLSQDVDAIFQQATSEVFSRKAQENVSPPTPEEKTAWNGLINESNSVRKLLAMRAKARAEGKYTSGVVGVVPIVGAETWTHRQDIVQLIAKYKDDMPAFQTFNDSEPGIHLVRAQIAKRPVDTERSTEYMKQWQAEIEQFQPSWKQLYDTATR